jgi:integration host factor subunit alpha
MRLKIGAIMTVTKIHLAECLQNDCDLNKKKSSQVIETIIEEMKRSLEKGEDVLITNFGKFCAKNKKPRRGRNPQTGEDLILGARRVVTFKCSGVLKEKLNGRN